MHPIDWLLFALPVAFVIFVALRAQRYVHGVADFLSAGRIARRYTLCVASGEANFGLITLLGALEGYYNSGFAYSFWGAIIAPVGMVLGLVGFCNYRFRETRAMTMGQFFEMRYNRPFRTVASFVQALYGVLNYAIFPAVGARFLMYFLRLPVSFHVLGLEVSTFAALMLLALGLACFIACAGGQITIMATDCVQGILSYPIYLAVAAFLLLKFSWRRARASSIRSTRATCATSTSSSSCRASWARSSCASRGAAAAMTAPRRTRTRRRWAPCSAPGARASAR